ncbi:MAG TPA: hypothetical protein PLG75_12265 [Methanoculleus sp.]|nr:hypothetical protein [Methanoculleus sp.]
MVRVAAVEACERALSPGTCRYRIARAAAFVFLCILVIPLLLGLAFGVPPPAVLALVASTLLLQAAAAVVGLSLGLPPAVVLVFLTSVAVAVMIGILEVCDLFAGSSRRVQGLLQKIDAKTGRIDYLKRYGALMLIPIIWIPGIALYGAPVVAWLFQYRRTTSLLCMIAGWMVAVVAVMAAAVGLVRLAF